MAIERQVKCIIKTDRFSRHEAISHIGGDWGRIPESEAIGQIIAKTHDYYVSVNGYRTKVVVRMHENRLYLKTESDTSTVDNLLSLDSCLQIK